eukprot:COSAG04_NODE_1185_length_7876_cov_15.856629_2_plen_248_part_00
MASTGRAASPTVIPSTAYCRGSAQPPTPIAGQRSATICGSKTRPIRSGLSMGDLLKLTANGYPVSTRLGCHTAGMFRQLTAGTRTLAVVARSVVAKPPPRGSGRSRAAAWATVQTPHAILWASSETCVLAVCRSSVMIRVAAQRRSAMPPIAKRKQAAAPVPGASPGMARAAAPIVKALGVVRAQAPTAPQFAGAAQGRIARSGAEIATASADPNQRAIEIRLAATPYPALAHTTPGRANPQPHLYG